MGALKNNPNEDQQKPAQQVPDDETTRTILGQFDEKKAEHVEELDKLFDKRISSSKLHEIARVEVNELREKQKVEVANIYDNLKKQFEETQSPRHELAAELLVQAQSEAEVRIKNMQLILNLIVKKGEYMTEEEAEELKRKMIGIDKNLMQDSQTQEILIKLQPLPQRQELTPADYEHVVGMINPQELTSFDTTTAGILIGFMNEKQRYLLVQEFMGTSEKQEHTGKFIDGLLRAGLLSMVQGKELFEQARHAEPPLMTEEEFATAMGNFDSGFYLEESKKVRDTISKEVTRLKGLYNHNMFDRVIGSPLLGAGMILHSVFWFLTNVLATGGRLADIKNMLKKNPYFWASIAEGAAGVEMVSGSIHKGTGKYGFGSGAISRAMERITEKEGAQSTAEQNAYRLIGETYTNYPDFGAYLEHGGAESIIALRKEKIGSGLTGENIQISYEELLNAEENDDQRGRLEAAHNKFGQKTLMQINTTAEACHILQFEKQSQFNNKLAYLKQEQGLQSETPDVQFATAEEENEQEPPTANT